MRCSPTSTIPRILSILMLALHAPLSNAATITVAAAISLKDALTPIAADFQRQTGHQVRLHFGSSGQLLAQVTAGAPIDLFIPAAEKQMDIAAEGQLVIPETRQVVAGNTLVLIVPQDSTLKLRSFEELADPSVRKVAMGEPKTVPAGEYAAQVLAVLRLDDALTGKLVYGANVRQVLNYVQRGEVAAGIVYKTDALLAGDDVKVLATAYAEHHRPIVYPGAVVRATKAPDAARAFLDHLAGNAAKQMLVEKGFTVPPAKSQSKEISR